jgi:TonB family protein
METVVELPADAELHLLTDWGDADSAARRKKAVVGTVLVHAAVIGVLVAMPPVVVEPEKPHEVTHVTILEPVTELTQKAPNKGKITKEFESRLETPRTAVQAPAVPPPPKPKAETPKPAAIPPAPPPKPATPPPALPEPPKIDAGIKEPPKTDLPAIAQNAPAIPAPQIQTVEKPKLALDPVAPAAAPSGGQGRIPNPNASIADTIRDIARAPSSTSVIGDPGASESGYGGISQRPSPGTPLSNIQLLSDPQGVDFVPYLRQLLQTVKRNWIAVMPQSVKLGRRGKVVIQFRIAKNGTVTKAAYAQNSGSEALDKAAIAGISASNPFQPLPAEFKGDSIVLQLNFVYR